ncbi:hypothetical protein B0I31_103783, partial [Saccharothrix carnea]
MTRWLWSRGEAPEALAGFVRQDVVGKLLPAELAADLPGPGTGRTRAEKARVIYEVFARRGVRYVDEPSTSVPGGQLVRPVDQVLARPRQGTCLDLCVAYAGACLDAGLHPLIVVVDSVRARAAHAVVLVWLDGSWSTSPEPAYPLQGLVHASPPTTTDGLPLLREIRASADGAGAFLAVDVAGAAWPFTADHPAKDWAAAVRDGASVLLASDHTSQAWRWASGIDVGLSRQLHAVEVADSRFLPGDVEPLNPAYREPNTAAGPLTQIKARHGLVPFYARDELDLLQEWAHADATSPDGVELAVVHGVGGAGKTHLAAELCARLQRQGWYTGFFPKSTLDNATWTWLSTVVPKTLVVVDYVEDTSVETVVKLIRTMRRREQTTRILFTARSAGDWLHDIVDAARREGVDLAEPWALPLPRRHPSPTGLFRRAAQRFAQLPGAVGTAVGQPPDNPRWTTLDLVLQAWLATHGVDGDALPARRDALYDEILRREFDYWYRAARVFDTPEPHNEMAIRGFRELAGKVGAVLTLLAPRTTERVTRAVETVPELRVPTPERAGFIGLLTKMLAPDHTDEGFAIRPDPVGERLVLREFGRAGRLLDDCLPPNPSTDRRHARDPGDPDALTDALATDWETAQACTVLTRAEEFDPEQATALAQRLLTQHTWLWSTAYSVTRKLGGPFATALTQLALREDTPLPLAVLAEEIPLGHAALRDLAHIVAERAEPSHDPTVTKEINTARHAAWLNTLAVRRSEVGDRGGALAAVDEAVTHYRQLAEGNPRGFLPNLAGSLNNQANLRSEVGDRGGALAAVDEAVTHYRQLAEGNPRGFLPNLAGSLNNQANLRRGVGDRGGALAAVDEAVTHYRQLAEGNPGGFLPNLATSLNSQAASRSEVGDRAGALAAIDEAVLLRRQLAESNPGAFLPNLAISLNNQANLRSEVGDRGGALAAIDEAVTHYRQLAEG